MLRFYPFYTQKPVSLNRSRHGFERSRAGSKWFCSVQNQVFGYKKSGFVCYEMRRTCVAYKIEVLATKNAILYATKWLPAGSKPFLNRKANLYHWTEMNEGRSGTIIGIA